LIKKKANVFIGKFIDLIQLSMLWCA